MNKSKVKNLPPIDTGYRPQVLLLGNGLSRCMGSDSWKDIIEGFIEKYHCPFSYENIKNLPANMQAVVATGNRVNAEMKMISRKLMTDISEADKEFVRKVIGFLPLDAIMTTNYDYNLEQSFGVPNRLYSYQQSRRWAKEVSGVQEQFGLFQYSVSNETGDEKRFFHVHGDLCRPTGMIMGQYYYGKLLAQISNYVPDVIKRFNTARNSGETFKPLSWVDYFLLGDIYIIGLQLYPCEIDLWWLLECKRRRFPGTKVFYFHRDDSDVDTDRKLLMECMGVQLVPTRVDRSLGENQRFRSNYIASSEEIRKRIENNKGNIE